MKCKQLVRGIAALAACALLLPITVGAKKQVTRPFMINGNVVVVFTEMNADYLSFEGVDWGEATHLGRYYSLSEGRLYLTGPYAGMALTSGTCTAANGDSFTWDATEVMGLDQMTVTITGGTGRFAGASGGFVCQHSPIILAPVVTYTYQGAGTIVY